MYFRVTWTVEGQINRIRNSEDYFFDCSNWSEGDKGGSMGELIKVLSCYLNCEPGFTYSTRSDKSYTSRFRFSNKRTYLVKIQFSSDKGGQLNRKVEDRCGRNTGMLIGPKITEPDLLE